MTWGARTREQQLALNAKARAEREAARAAKRADPSINRLRRRYGLTQAPAALLMTILAAPDDQPVSWFMVAQGVGRSHRSHASIAPHLVAVRRAVGPGVVTVRGSGVTLTPELREQLREVLS